MFESTCEPTYTLPPPIMTPEAVFISYLNSVVPVGIPNKYLLFILLGHVTEVSNVNVSAGVTEDDEIDTVQSL